MSAIDFEAICAPLDAAAPCGIDLREDMRFDSPYQRLKTLREEAMAIERGNRAAIDDEGDSDPAQLRGKWRSVVECAASILTESSKDIEVCALLIEGLVRTDGIAGLRVGFATAAALISTRWSELHPRIDPNDPDSLEDRLAPFNGIDGGGQPGTVARFIPRLYLTNSGEADFQSYQLEQAFQAGAVGALDEGRTASNLGFDIATIERSAQRTDTAFYQTMLDDLAECEKQFTLLDAAFEEHCGFDAPSTSTIKEALEKLGSNLRFLAGERLAQSAPGGEAGGTAAPDPTGASRLPASSEKSAPGAVNSRADAVRRLREVASFFRESEPHSPLSYSLDNLARWAGLPLDKLIDEWISDDTARERYRLMTGMGREDGGDG